MLKNKTEVTKVKTYTGNLVGVSEDASIAAVRKAFAEVDSGEMVTRLELTPNELILHTLKIIG